MKLLASFNSKYIPEPNSGCWLWEAGCSRSGYGYISQARKMRQAHVVAYELFVGRVPEGKELDHLCGVRCCVNPAHLEPVTHRENLRRGKTLIALNNAKRTCCNGHEFTAENTYVWTDESRQCRICARQRKAKQRKAKKRLA